MSRRPPAPGADRTEQNRATLKQLVKLEPNKSCADCKRNKHPRWASWSIGIFLCIRCSGIHRGMGTHISRVKSVDLDSWTDEQMQNMIRWGNARANKYWEAKLADGHVPNEAKIENFIRTKYDSKRWIMDGPMPDPSSLDDGLGGGSGIGGGVGGGVADDDVPLNVVREKAIERRASQRNGSSGGIMAPPSRTRPQEVDLFGDSMDAAPARPSTTEPVRTPKATPAPPKQTKPGESLLGLDFFGGSSSAAPARPSSTGPSTPGVPGRADLKSSILSLYAAKPATAPQPQVQQQQPASMSNMDAFAGMSSPPLTSPMQSQTGTQSSFGGMNDAFGGLSFNSSQPKSPGFPSTTTTSSTTQARQASSKPGGDLLSGGSFFDAKPAPPPKQTSPPIQPTNTKTRTESIGSGFGDFSSASPVTSQPTSTSMTSPPVNTSSMGDLFDMSAPSPPTSKPPAYTPAAAPVPPPVQAKQPPPINYSAFNLSSQPPPQPASVPKPAAATPAISNFGSLSNMDAWGSNDAWATPDPPSQPAAAPPPIQTSTTSPTTFKAAPAPAMQTPFDSGWGSPPKVSGGGGFSVQQDEEFGGWSHASPVATSATSQHAPKQSQGGSGGGGFGGSRPMNTDDLFGNVWE